MRIISQLMGIGRNFPYWLLLATDVSGTFLWSSWYWPLSETGYWSSGSPDLICALDVLMHVRIWGQNWVEWIQFWCADFLAQTIFFWWFGFRCHRKFPYHSQIEHVGKSAVPSGRRAELGNKMRVPDLNQRGSSTMNGEYFHRNCGYFSSQMSGLDL